MRADEGAPLRIAYLTYRGKPHVGGQGVYTRHLTKALVDLGHTVEVFGGQPYPVLDERVDAAPSCPASTCSTTTTPAASPPTGSCKHWEDWVEVLSSRRGTFSEPLAFSLRAWSELRTARRRLRPRARQPVPRLRRARHRAS